MTYGRMQIYQGPPPPIDHRSMEDHYTDYVSHIEDCTDTSVDRPHLSLLQLSIHFWKIITPHKFHIYHNAHIPMAD